MCARYETLPDGHEPFSHVRLTWASPELSETRREMFPGYLGPVVRVRNGEIGLDAMRWGLVPFWARDPDPRKFRNTFNARAETAESLPSFRAPFKTRRCLVPAHSFAEFPTLNGKKIRHRVTRSDGQPLMFAGLWDRWSGAGTELLTFTVITAESHPELLWLHHRMPVPLEGPAQLQWLDPATPVDVAKDLLRCPAPEVFSAVPA